MTLRRLLFQVHLYAGLTVGLVLAVVGLSGSALVFGDELDRSLHPELRRVVPAGAPVPLSRVIVAVAESQGGQLPRHLRVPETEGAPLEAWMDSQGRLKVYVDPYSGVVLGARSAGQSLVGILRSLHVSLFAGRVGEGIVGLSGLALMVLCVSGLVLWWPGRRKLAEGLTLRRPLRWRRANHDLHKLGGLVSLALLLLAGLTGAALVFPAPFEHALRLATGAQPRSAPPTSKPLTGEPLPLDVLLAQADRAMPGARTTRIDLPTTPAGALRVRKRFPQEPHPNGMSFVHVDRHSGAVLRAESALEASGAARLMALRYPLHIGTLGGAVTRLLAVLTGLFPAGLFLTGLFLWVARLRARPSPQLSPRMTAVTMRQRHIVRGLLVAASSSVLVLGAPPASAQTPAATEPSEAASAVPLPTPESAEFSEEMVVTATRRPEATATVPGSVTVITREQLVSESQASHRNLGETLGKLVPGLSLGSQSASTFGQTLRGRNVLVMIDGVPQSSLRNVQHDLQGIDLSAVERVEVVRGTTAIYGEGASGGIINIITRIPRGASEFRFTTSLQLEAAPVQTGQSLGGTLAQTAEGGRGPVSFSLAGSLARTGGFFDAQGDRIPADPHGQGGLADMEAFNLFGKAGVRLSPEQRLRLTANYYQGFQDTRFAIDPTVNQAPPLEQKARVVEGLDLPDSQGTRNTVLSLLYDHDALLGSSVRAQLYYRNHLTRFFPFDGRRFRTYGNQIIQSRLETQKGGGRLEVGTPLPLKLSALWGLDASLERTAQPVSLMDPAFFDESGGRGFRKIGEHGWVPRMDISTLGLFAQLEWQPLELITLRAGARHERPGLRVDDYTTLAGDDIPGASLSFSRTLFNVGGVVRATQELNAFINFSQGYSLPDVGLILRNAPAGSTVADLETAPQAVDLWEAGLRGDWERVQGSVSVFYNRSDLGTSSGGLNAPVVRAPERVYGLEATLDVQPVERLSLGTTFTWLEGQLDKGDDGSYTFLNSYRIPPLKLTGSVEHETLPGWRNAVGLVYSGRRNRFPTSTAFGERPVEAFFTVDLMSSLEVGPGTLRVAVSNLLNRHYFTRESQLLRSGANDSYAAARGALVSVGYSLSY